jgi:glycosyltransferase-like protein LARGE
VKNKHSDFFLNLYYTFVGFDGNLLRRQLFHCNNSISTFSTEVTPAAEDACAEIRKARDAKYRTHLFYLAYKDANKVDNDTITWVAQLSFDRLHMIEPLFTLWEGI